MYGKELIEVFKEFKAIWDPEWRMNPGKIVNTLWAIKRFALSDQYNPIDPKTHFKFPADNYSFSQSNITMCRRWRMPQS